MTWVEREPENTNVMSIECPGCGEWIMFTEYDAGRTIRCAKCSLDILVPLIGNSDLNEWRTRIDEAVAKQRVPIFPASETPSVAEPLKGRILHDNSPAEISPIVRRAGKRRIVILVLASALPALLAILFAPKLVLAASAFVFACLAVFFFHDPAYAWVRVQVRNPRPVMFVVGGSAVLASLLSLLVLRAHWQAEREVLLQRKAVRIATQKAEEALSEAQHIAAEGNLPGAFAILEKSLEHENAENFGQIQALVHQLEDAMSEKSVSRIFADMSEKNFSRFLISPQEYADTEGSKAGGVRIISDSEWNKEYLRWLADFAPRAAQMRREEFERRKAEENARISAQARAQLAMLRAQFERSRSDGRDLAKSFLEETENYGTSSDFENLVTICTALLENRSRDEALRILARIQPLYERDKTLIFSVAKSTETEFDQYLISLVVLGRSALTKRDMDALRQACKSVNSFKAKYSEILNPRPAPAASSVEIAGESKKSSETHAQAPIQPIGEVTLPRIEVCSTCTGKRRVLKWYDSFEQRNGGITDSYGKAKLAADRYNEDLFNAKSTPSGHGLESFSSSVVFLKDHEKWSVLPIGNGRYTIVQGLHEAPCPRCGVPPAPAAEPPSQAGRQEYSGTKSPTPGVREDREKSNRDGLTKDLEASKADLAKMLPKLRGLENAVLELEKKDKAFTARINNSANYTERGKWEAGKRDNAASLNEARQNVAQMEQEVERLQRKIKSLQTKLDSLP